MASTDETAEKCITVRNAVMVAIMVFLAGFLTGVLLCNKMVHQ